MVTSLDNDDGMRVGAEYGMDGTCQFWNMHKSTQNIPEVKKQQQMNEKNGCVPVFQQAEMYTKHTKSDTKKGDGDPHTNHKKNHQTTNNGQERQSTLMDNEL